jgi:hypothetical protein
VGVVLVTIQAIQGQKVKPKVLVALAVEVTVELVEMPKLELQTVEVVLVEAVAQVPQAVLVSSL